MKFVKLCAMFAAASIAVGASADARKVMFSFSTPQYDCYADGTTHVVDGEWYALCWSSDGNFDGIDINCSPVGDADKVFLMAPLAVDGHCPTTFFQLDYEDAPKDGYYCVYILDTRDGEGKASEAKSGDESSRLTPALVNGAVAAKIFKVESGSSIGSSNFSITSITNEVDGAAWVASAVGKDVPNPEVYVFTPASDADDEVVIKVKKLVKGIRYNVVMGASLDKLETYSMTPKTSDDGTAEFHVNPGAARFFKVVRQPL